MRREDLARSIVDAVLEVPGVARLHPGFGVEVATLFSGGKITGLRLAGATVELYIVADLGPLPLVARDAAAAARRVLAAAGDARPVDIVIADVEPAALERRAGARQAARDGIHAGG